MKDPTCVSLRKSARLIQQRMVEIGGQLPHVYGYRAQQILCVDQISDLVEAYERRIEELLVPFDLPPIEADRGGGYKN